MYLIWSAPGQYEQVDGTSASCPVFAAMVTLWNALRLQSGKPTLGHVAPAIYAAFQKDPTYFQDVTDGNNTCTEYCCSQQVLFVDPVCVGLIS
jgi:hypothetical protein